MKCLHCGEVLESGRRYCSSECQGARSKSISLQKWLRKEIPGHKGKAMVLKRVVREYVIAKYGGKCSKCDWCVPHPLTGKPPLEVDHIDGNASNSYEENLIPLCPNCHSLTLTYKHFNKNGKRFRRDGAMSRD